MKRKVPVFTDRSYDIAYPSQDDKAITGRVCEPLEMNAETGLLLVVHGWGNNRFQYVQDMNDYAQRYNVVCVSPDYRGCGFDYDPIGGIGTTLPYDFSHMQLVDSLNAIPAVLEKFPRLNQERILGWGGSQGGHIILLAAAFAPSTFAFVVDMCGLTHATEERLKKSQREDMAQADRDIRNVHRWVDRMRCKVMIIHGMADPLVDCQMAMQLERDLQSSGVPVEAHFIPGGNHSLEPVSSRYQETIRWASQDYVMARKEGAHDFALRGQQTMPCSGRAFVLDYTTGRARWLE
jgi:dipeptidyl aminopeptidase/acylaminoacyl peptidase